jgi:hypothetical protein
MVLALMITPHHLNNSRSQRILWLLEELELPYEIVIYQRDADTRLAPGSLKKVHPLGKSPASGSSASAPDSRALRRGVGLAEVGREHVPSRHAQGRDDRADHESG